MTYLQLFCQLVTLKVKNLTLKQSDVADQSEQTFLVLHTYQRWPESHFQLPTPLLFNTLNPLSGPKFFKI